MRRWAIIAPALALLAGASACDSQGQHDKPAPIDTAELARREQHLAATLVKPDPESVDAPLARWVLPKHLREISGLALTTDGRLLAHGDERGHVFEVDYRRGVVVKEFTLGTGNQAVKGDFEGITVAGATIYLLASNGKLYDFHEGAEGASVDYTVHDTGLGETCEFEGVAFAKTINSLLLACKNVHDKALKDSLVIFRWKLEGDSTRRLSRLTVPLARVIGSNGWKGVHPSDITVEPFNGNYVLIASRERAIVELTPDGKVVFARALPGEHAQPEGVAITRDSILIISDEAGDAKNPPLTRPAVITLYRWR